MITINKKILPDLAKFIEMRYGVDVLKHKERDAEIMNALLRMQYWINDAVLADYFNGGEGWWSNEEKFATRRTGKQLIDHLKEQGEDIAILDVGCGNNEVKKLVGDNVLGIDPYNPDADMQKDIMNFNKDVGKWDIVLCLGSINFGDALTIEKQVVKSVTMLKPGGDIYFRCNPGITHDHDMAKWIDFYPWTHEKLHELAELNKCIVVEEGWDHPEENEDIRWGNRLFQHWKKKDGLRKAD